MSKFCETKWLNRPQNGLFCSTPWHQSFLSMHVGLCIINHPKQCSSLSLPSFYSFTLCPLLTQLLALVTVWWFMYLYASLSDNKVHILWCFPTVLKTRENPNMQAKASILSGTRPSSIKTSTWNRYWSIFGMHEILPIFCILLWTWVKTQQCVHHW